MYTTADIERIRTALELPKMPEDIAKAALSAVDAYYASKGTRPDDAMDYWYCFFGRVHYLAKYYTRDTHEYKIYLIVHRYYEQYVQAVAAENDTEPVFEDDHKLQKPAMTPCEMGAVWEEGNRAYVDWCLVNLPHAQAHALDQQN